jgi:probable phosphoglycerate mutase
VALLSSSAQRAAGTAEVVSERCGLELQLDDRLCEVDNGTWAGLTAAEVRERFPEEYTAWRRGEDIRLGGAESYREVAERAAAAVQPALEALGEGELLAVVTHGGVARALAGRLLGLPHEHWRSLAGLKNCTWSLLTERAERWVLQGHGLGAHRPRS